MAKKPLQKLTPVESEPATVLVRIRKSASDLLKHYSELLNISLTQAASEAITDWATHTAEARVRYNAQLQKQRRRSDRLPGPVAVKRAAR